MNNTVSPNSETRSDTTDDGSSVDELFDVLTAERRRHVLSILTDSQSMVAVEDLAQDVTARENDVAAITVSEATAHDVHVSLHHVHLPKLDEAGLVDYDWEDRTVSATATTDAVPIDIE